MMNDMGEITPEVKCYPATPKIKTMNIEWNFQVPSDWTNSSLTNPKEEASSDDSSDKNGIRYKITQYPETGRPLSLILFMKEKSRWNVPSRMRERNIPQSVSLISKKRIWKAPLSWKMKIKRHC